MQPYRYSHNKNKLLKVGKGMYYLMQITNISTNRREIFCAKNYMRGDEPVEGFKIMLIKINTFRNLYMCLCIYICVCVYIYNTAY